MIALEETELFHLVEELRKGEGLTEAFLADTRLKMSVLSCHAVVHEADHKEKFLDTERQRKLLHAIEKQRAINAGETAAKAESIATEKTAEVKREEVQYESQYYRLKVFREQINAVLNAISTKLK